MAVILML